jgi:hypothetical protein
MTPVEFALSPKAQQLRALLNWGNLGCGPVERGARKHGGSGVLPPGSDVPANIDAIKAVKGAGKNFASYCPPRAAEARFKARLIRGTEAAE